MSRTHPVVRLFAVLALALALFVREEADERAVES